MAGSPATVVHVVASLEIGGLERVVLDLVKHVDRSRFAPRVVCLEHRGVLSARVTALGIPVDCLAAPGGGTVRAIVRLARYLREVNADIVHTHNVKPHLHGALAAGLARVPVTVSTKHGRNVPTRPLGRMANRVACRMCSDLVGVSADCAAIWHDVESANARKVSVITNGIDLGAFALPAPPPSGSRRAVSVARLSAVKDPLTLLEAARLVLDREPAFQLDLVGDGPLRGEVERSIVCLRLGDAVRVHGALDDVRPVLREAGFFVSSSTSEGVSLTLLEAMAAGLPAVATQVGGNPEVVEHGKTGVLVPPREPAALADAMTWMVRQPGARERMGGAARRRVEEHFDVRRTVAAYERMYLRALDSRQHGARTAAVRPTTIQIRSSVE
jgi:glycosyltransferase involved in cell wall biosynthesis